MRNTSVKNTHNYYINHWKTVLVVMIIGLGVGYLYGKYLQVPSYVSDARVIVTNGTPSDTGSLASTYSDLIKSRKVLESAIEDSKLDVTFEELYSSVHVNTKHNSQLIEVSFIADSAEESSKNLKGILESLETSSKEFYGIDLISVVDEPNTPSSGFNPYLSAQLLVSAVGGFLLSLIILSLAKRSDREGDDILPTSSSPEKVKSNQKRAKKDDSVIILGDNDDLEDNFLFDEDILEDITDEDTATAQKSKSQPTKSKSKRM